MNTAEAHQVSRESIEKLFMCYDEPGMMTTYKDSLIRARFRQIERDFCPVLEMLDQYRVRLYNRRATPTTAKSIRIDLTVLRRWLIYLQHQIDVTRDRLVRGVVRKVLDLRILKNTTPVVCSSTTICSYLYRVLIQL